MKINFFLILAGGLLSYSCETETENVRNVQSINIKNIDTYIIDSCEYIGYMNVGNGDVLTHKGNCKYCLKRQKL